MAEAQRPGPPPDPGLPLFVRVILYVVGFFALLFLLATILATVYMSPERVEQILNDQLEETTQGRFEARVGGTSVGLLTRSFALSDVAIVPTDVALDEETRPPRYHLAVDRMRASGIGVWNLLRNQRFTASSVSIIRPVVEMQTVDEPFEAEEYIEQLRTLPQQEQLAGTWIGSIRIDDARISMTPLEGFEGLSHTLEGFSMHIDDLFLDPEATEDENRLLIARALSVDLDRYHGLTSDELYSFELSDLSVDTPDSTFSFAGMTFAPTVSDEQFFAQQPWSTSRYQADVGTLELEGIDYRALVTDLAFTARTAALDTFHVDVFHDATDEEAPETEGAFPHEALQEMGMTIAVDDMSIGRGFVQYAERAPGAEEPGVVTFEAVEALVEDVFSAPDQRAERPTVIEAQTLLNGEGLLEVSAEYDLTAPEFFFDAEGTLSEMSLLPFNRTFERLEAIRITGGRVVYAAFDMSVRQGVAEGMLRFQYEGLGLEVVEGAVETRVARVIGELLGEEQLLDRLLPDVPDEDRDFEASIYLERDPDHSFFEFLWLALRDPLFEVLGLEELQL